MAGQPHRATIRSVPTGRHKKNPKTTYALGGTQFVASLRFLSRAAGCWGMGPSGPTYCAIANNSTRRFNAQPGIAPDQHACSALQQSPPNAHVRAGHPEQRTDTVCDRREHRRTGQPRQLGEVERRPELTIACHSFLRPATMPAGSTMSETP